MSIKIHELHSLKGNYKREIVIVKFVCVGDRGFSLFVCVIRACVCAKIDSLWREKLSESLSKFC